MTRKIPELDGVRGLAAIMVIVFHINQKTAPDGFLLKMMHKTGTLGQTGVILFFVLSGFLITGILLATKNSRNYFSTFYLKRSLRIFPLYYLSLMIFLIIIPLLETGRAIPFSESWYFWVYLQNIAITFKGANIEPGHFWSLAVEEHFYFLWPFLVYMLSEKNLVKAIGLIIALGFAVRVVLEQNGYGSFFFTLSTMDCMAIGGLVALNHRHNWVSYKTILLSFIVLMLLLLVSWMLFKNHISNFVSLVKHPLLSLFFGSLISMLIVGKSFFNRIFKLKILTFTGTISYGLYIFHPICITYASRYFSGSLLVSVIFAASYATAIISFYMFEQWFLRKKARLDKKEEPVPVLNVKANNLRQPAQV